MRAPWSPASRGDGAVELACDAFERGDIDLPELEVRLDHALGKPRARRRPARDVVEEGARAVAEAEGASWAMLGVGQRERCLLVAEAVIEAALPMVG